MTNTPVTILSHNVKVTPRGRKRVTFTLSIGGKKQDVMPETAVIGTQVSNMEKVYRMRGVSLYLDEHGRFCYTEPVQRTKKLARLLNTIQGGPVFIMGRLPDGRWYATNSVGNIYYALSGINQARIKVDGPYSPSAWAAKKYPSIAGAPLTTIKE